MSLGDIFDFEFFNLKDMWKKIKKDPERLFLGAADPFSSEMWGKILGKDYEPIVDQFGGPYGGSWISMGGNTNQGVYGRAEQAGIDTNDARNVHNVAHVIAALMAGNYGLGKLPQGQQSPYQFGGQQQQQQPYEPPQTPNFFEIARRRAQEKQMRDQVALQLSRIHRVG